MSTEEDNYAARIGRAMWRVAKRRAEELRLYGRACEPAHIGCAEAGGADNKAPPPVPPHGPAPTQSESALTLSEFLRALAAELAQDEPDRDGK